MKKIFIFILGFIFLGIGLTMLSYPFISNYLMSQNHESEIKKQQSAVNNLAPDVIEQELKAAEIYNSSLQGQVILTDPFDPGLHEEEDAEYESLLNINGDSIMAVLEIPKISVKLPVYHGTSDEVLKKGSGHLQKTSLPVGGKGTHAVLTGHTGLSNARMFTDLEKLEEGDVFFVYVLNRVLAYEVNQIKVVEPANTSDLKINADEDYVTLMTCTPYGVNTHRLLVRGVRIPYEQAEEIINQTVPAKSRWLQEYKRALAAGATVSFLVLLIFIILKIWLKNHQKVK